MIIVFQPEGRRSEVRSEEILIDVAHRSGVGIRSDCGGEGTCGKCRVVVENGALLNEPSQEEGRHLSPKEMASGYRLACQVSIPPAEGEIVVSIPPESREGERSFQLVGIDQEIGLAPAISKRYVQMDEPTLEDPMPDVERMMRTLDQDLDMDLEVMGRLSSVLREGGWGVTVTSWKDKVISVEAGDTTGRMYGFAVDIGTSKIVGHLVDLVTGATVSINARENPQLPYGEDVMSRIIYSSRSTENLERMIGLVRDSVNDLLVECCSRTAVSIEEVYETVLVGNTVMHHIFLGLPPLYLSHAPYAPTVRRPIDVNAGRLGIKGNHGSNLHFLPTVAGFVGADAAADVVATKIHESPEMSLLIDIGTNTEVFLGNREELVCCSCASGPAFEGMHLKHGMKAVSGAIEKFAFQPEGIRYQTIDGGKPIGICGSGVLDIIAELFSQGLISNRGYFKDPSGERFLSGKDGEEYIVAGREETASGENITVSEEDILVILMAKAAIAAGCRVLMKHKGVVEEDIDRVLMAGAFGNCLDIPNAEAIGLIPDIPLDRIQCVGNVSISGAKMCLLSTEMREDALRLSSEVKYLELAAEPEFTREFNHSMYIPHKKAGRS